MIQETYQNGREYYHHELVEWFLISLASGIVLSAFAFIALLCWLTIRL